MRDSRFAELDYLIANPKRRKVSPEAREAYIRNLARADAANRRMTPNQKRQLALNRNRCRKYSRSCECGKCLKCRHREAARKWKRKVAAAKAPKRNRYTTGKIPHGTFSGYNDHACRCQICRDCMAANARRRKIAS